MYSFLSFSHIFVAPGLSLGICLFEHFVPGCLSLVRGGGRSHTYMSVEVTECGGEDPALQCRIRQGLCKEPWQGQWRGGEERALGRAHAPEGASCLGCGVFPVHLPQRQAQEMPVLTGLVASCVWETRAWLRPLRFGERDLASS